MLFRMPIHHICWFINKTRRQLCLPPVIRISRLSRVTPDAVAAWPALGKLTHLFRPRLNHPGVCFILWDSWRLACSTYAQSWSIMNTGKRWSWTPVDWATELSSSSWRENVGDVRCRIRFCKALFASNSAAGISKLILHTYRYIEYRQHNLD